MMRTFGSALTILLLAEGCIACTSNCQNQRLPLTTDPALTIELSSKFHCERTPAPIPYSLSHHRACWDTVFVVFEGSELAIEVGVYLNGVEPDIIYIFVKIPDDQWDRYLRSYIRVLESTPGWELVEQGKILEEEGPLPLKGNLARSTCYGIGYEVSKYRTGTEILIDGWRRK